MRRRAARCAGGTAVAGVLLVLLTACVPSLNTPDAPDAPDARDDAADSALASEVLGTWAGQAEGDAAPELTFVDDGTFSGTDGCNRLAGRWEADDAEIEFDDVAITQMACSGFTSWLDRLDTASVSGNTLTVFDDPGAEIGTLTRS